MKKIFIVLILTLLLSGCGLYNLGGFVLPDDMEFMAVVESLDTPEKICSYMMNNFTYKAHLCYDPDPYTFWKTGEGDCNDFSTFGTFVANYHGYEVYQIIIVFNDCKHFLGVYSENHFSFSDNWLYCREYMTFKDIVKVDSVLQGKEWVNYKVFNYNMDIIEKGVN